MPIQVQWFRLCLMRFKYSCNHIPWNDLPTVDTPSRLPILKAYSKNLNSQKEVDALVDLITNSLPATSIKLEEIKKVQVQDKLCTEI